MIGYVVAQELRTAMAPRAVACLLTQTLTDGGDPAFDRPTKPIGPLFASLDAARSAARPDWTLLPEGKGYRRFVPSPRPIGIVEFDEIRRLVHHGIVTVCCGGGGIAVVRSAGRLEGVDAIIDKDWTAAMLALELDADQLVILTDVDAVYIDWGAPGQRPLRELRASEIHLHGFAEGSMLPKVAAAAHFVEATGRPAMIGALSDAVAVVSGLAGTTIVP
jgi:carbamate kinase